MEKDNVTRVLEDFEVFDLRDAFNVGAYSFMSCGEFLTLFSLTLLIHLSRRDCPKVLRFCISPYVKKRALARVIILGCSP